MNSNNSWTFLTPEQIDRATGEVVMHTRGKATPETIKAVLNRLESIAANAKLWELWTTEKVEVSWDGRAEEVAWFTPEPDDDDSDPFGLGQAGQQ